MRTLQLLKGAGRFNYYLRLVSANGQVLVTSEGYYSKWNAKRAAKKNFPDETLKDMTQQQSTSMCGVK